VDPNDHTLTVKWCDPEEKSLKESVFQGSFLRAYADVVAQPLAKEEATRFNSGSMEWLEPYTGFPEAKAPRKDEMRHWKGVDPGFEHFDYSQVLSEAPVNLKLAKALMRDGVAMIDNVPDAEDAEVLRHFTYEALGGLQKDPAREEPNWKIQKRENAKSISYDHDKGLNLHTDQSIPPHGEPGLLLSMHYVEGTGANTLVDAFAAAEELRRTDPEGFELLATYGYDAERDFIASRVDSAQQHTKRLLVTRKNKIFQTDADGNLKRVMYNEVFRTPLTLPYDVFPKWYKAFNKYVDMIHSDEWRVVQPMQKGQILLMHNWRVMHGRKARSASPTRTVVGGTITREAFYSKSRELVREVEGVDMPH